MDQWQQWMAQYAAPKPQWPVGQMPGTNPMAPWVQSPMQQQATQWASPGYQPHQKPTHQSGWQGSGPSQQGGWQQPQWVVGPQVGQGGTGTFDSGGLDQAQQNSHPSPQQPRPAGGGFQMPKINTPGIKDEQMRYWSTYTNSQLGGGWGQLEKN